MFEFFKKIVIFIICKKKEKKEDLGSGAMGIYIELRKTGGRQENSTQGCGKFHPGFWKIPPRVWVHLGFWKIQPRLLENPTQGSGKLQNLHEPCDYTFLDKQVSESLESSLLV